MSRKRRWVALGSAALMAFGVAACGSSNGGGGGSGSSGAKKLHLAAVEDLTGPAAVFGPPIKGGIDTAVKEINDAGGIDGAQLVVKHYDSQSDPNVAQSVFREALTSKPDVVIGAVAGAEVVATAPILAAGNVPVVTPALPNSATEKIPFWFSLGVTGDQTATGVLTGMKQVLGGGLKGKKIAFAGVNSPAVDPMLAAVKQQVQAAGGSVGPVIRDPLGFTSWTSQAANVVDARADGLVMIYPESGTVVAAKALAVAGFHGPIVSPTNASSDTLLKAIDLPNFTAVRVARNPAPGSDLFKVGTAAGVSAEAMAASYYAESYGTVYVLKAALDKCGVPCSGPDFAKAVRAAGDITIPHDTFFGPLNFSQGQTGVVMSQLYRWDSRTNAAVPVGGKFPNR